jgi:putative ABC transport system ATP-binding protein
VPRCEADHIAPRHSWHSWHSWHPGTPGTLVTLALLAPSNPLLIVDNVRRTYTSGDTEVHAVAGVSLEVAEGEFVALVGPSGCGKSTLLHLCGAMDRPSSGVVRLESVPLANLGDDELTRIRRERVGFVFQFFNLLPTLTLLENVELPLLLAGHRPTLAAPAARALLLRVGLAQRLGHYPAQLSGGELQRGAIARALVHRPALLVADEPTGNLDSENGRRVVELLRELNTETGITMLLATHAPDVAAAAHRTVRMRDGLIESVTVADAAL